MLGSPDRPISATRSMLAMLFAAVAAVATVLTLAMPLLATDALGKRMKAVALEREKIRQRERERLARGEKVALRQSPKQYMQTDRRAVQPDQMGRPGGSARDSWCRPAIAARRPTSPILFFRLVMPVVMLVVSLFYVFVVLELDQPATVKIGICLVGHLSRHAAAVACSSRTRSPKRQLSIKRAFPDALDLLLICVESGMSIEAAFRKVSAGRSARSRSRSPRN